MQTWALPWSQLESLVLGRGWGLGSPEFLPELCEEWRKVGGEGAGGELSINLLLYSSLSDSYGQVSPGSHGPALRHRGFCLHHRDYLTIGFHEFTLSDSQCMWFFLQKDILMILEHSSALPKYPLGDDLSPPAVGGCPQTTLCYWPPGKLPQLKRRASPKVLHPSQWPIFSDSLT